MRVGVRRVFKLLQHIRAPSLGRDFLGLRHRAFHALQNGGGGSEKEVKEVNEVWYR